MKKLFLVRAGLGGAPDQVTALVDTLERDSQTLRSTQEANGGLKRPLLKQAVAASLGGLAGLSASSTSRFASEEIDFVVTDRSLGISVQAGRAWTNNGALLAVLGAATDPSVEWLVVMVPETYKGSQQHAPIVRQLTDLVGADGVELDLAGIVLIAY